MTLGDVSRSRDSLALAKGVTDTERNEIRSKVRVSKVTKQDLGKGEEDHPQHKESDEDFK